MLYRDIRSENIFSKKVLTLQALDMVVCYQVNIYPIGNQLLPNTNQLIRPESISPVFFSCPDSQEINNAISAERQVMRQ